MFVLEPSDTEDALEGESQGGEQYDFYGFSVWGKFRVVEKINNPREAAERWKGFSAG